jgi:hypothetical protein
MSNDEFEELLMAVRRSRKQILDLLEVTCGHAPNWEAVRRNVLQVFGSNGLEGTVNAIRKGTEEERYEDVTR